MPAMAASRPPARPSRSSAAPAPFPLCAASVDVGVLLAAAVTSAVLTARSSLVVVTSEDEVVVMLRLTVRLPDVVAYRLAFMLGPERGDVSKIFFLNKNEDFKNKTGMIGNVPVHVLLLLVARPPAVVGAVVEAAAMAGLAFARVL